MAAAFGVGLLAGGGWLLSIAVAGASDTGEVLAAAGGPWLVVAGLVLLAGGGREPAPLPGAAPVAPVTGGGYCLRHPGPSTVRATPPDHRSRLLDRLPAIGPPSSPTKRP